MQALIESVGSLSAQEKKALAVLLKQQGINLFEIAPVFKRQQDEPLRLSYAQERQWFLWQLEPESTAYHVPRALRLNGPLDLAALQRSFDTLVARHESLRTCLQQDGDNTLQVIRPQMPIEILVVDADEARLQGLVEAQIARPFDLQQGPLLRVSLLRLAEDEHVLVLVQHHIVSDGWSMQVMVDELVQLYAACTQGRELQLPELPIQYADYALWQRSWMEAGEKERQLGYWLDRLGGTQPVLELPLDYPRPAIQSHRGARVDMTLEGELFARLKAVAQREGVTLFMLLLASFQTLLYRYSGQSDIRVGVPTANRNRVETERLIGFFVNTQVLKADIDGQMSFVQLLQQVKQRAIEAQAHQDLPFEQLVEALQPERSLSHNPLFQVMFNHQTDARGGKGAGPVSGLQVQSLEWESQTAQFDLNLDTQESAEGLLASLTYASDLFHSETAQRLLQHWQNLLQAVAANASLRVDELPMLDDAQWQRIVHGWNATEFDYPREQGVHQLFEALALARPGALALQFDDQSLTYAELNQRANRVAHRLITMGVGPDVLVAVSVERSAQMVISLLATLKAGGAYVPLDPQYPADRLAYMLEDSKARVLLTQQHLRQRLPQPAQLQVLLVEEAEADATCPVDNPQVSLAPEHLAYVIYTSGSTGKPKGVMVRHQALSSFTSGMATTLEIDADARVLSLTTFSFDIFALELYVPLTTGATVILGDKELALDPEAILDLLQTRSASVLQATPSTWRMLLDSPRASAMLRGIKCLCGGEALPADLAKRMLELQGAVWNLYGPTETTIWSAAHRLAEAQPFVGRPIANTSLFILDGGLTPCPQGAAGELLIGGVGLARGYHERPAMTAERFVPHPFSTSGERVYRTGDLSRYRAEGIVEYIGRVDHQVKVRGFRIELGEIEACLREQPAVREAAVLADNDRLIAYLVTHQVTAEADQATLREQFKAAMREALPDYMVPAYLIFLERMPLTPNGKLDRKALPKPDASLLQKRHVAPVSEREQQVAAIWADVLGAQQVGLEDHFFELGGHSLLATRVVSRVRQVLGIEVALKALFEQPVLGDFVQALGQGGAQMATIARIDRDQPPALSYAQERQWFLWQLEPQSAAYHIPGALRLTGQLDRTALQRAFDALVARHETLRTRFAIDGLHAVQVVGENSAQPVEYEVLPAVDAARLQERIEAEIARPFDLREGPLLRVKLLRLAEDEHVLVLVLHHIVADAWSMQVMVDELVRLYAAYSQGQELQLPELPIQYADYAAWQRNWMEAGEKQRQLEYWRGQLGQVQPVLELPLDHPRPATQSHRGARLDLALDAPLVVQLKGVAQREGVTLFMVLLASFQALLYRYSGQADIRIGVPIANRNRVETEGLIGFFVNTQVLKADIDGRMSFVELLQQVKRSALEAQAHQDLPFEQLVEALQPERSLSHNPLFQVMYNHQSEASGAAGPQQLPGLRVEGLEWDSHTAHFDLSLDTSESAEGIWASLTYATDLFDTATVQRLARDWQAMLQALASAPASLVGELELVGGADRQRMLEQWNAADDALPATDSVHGLFEVQAGLRPAALALMLDGQSMSYAELNQEANRLAHYLIEQGVGPEVLVGVAVERSFSMVVSLLAVLKAGGAYVPLDPEYPRERLVHMLEDSQLRLVLTQSHLRQRLPLPLELAVLDLDLARQRLQQCPVNDPQVVVDPLSLAYVIYTSGSTGKPKGVAINHAALSQFAQIAADYSRLTCDDRVLQFATLNFDGFVEQLYPALTRGASVVLRGPELWDSARLYQEIMAQGITLADLPTAYWNLFLLDCQAAGARSYGNLRQIHIGGEAMPLDGPAQWLRSGAGHVRLLNTYGPTEATVVSSVLDCSSLDEITGATASPIGRSLPGRALYVLDRDLNLAPLGAVGELYIGSARGLARAYLQRPLLTAERFVPDPFGEVGERLYRTGDLARYRADGVIEYAGRIDHQVKIRGFRIELGEIEALLLAQDSVRETVVLAADGQLVAYLVANQVHESPAAQQVLGDELKVALREQLPDYMVPAHLVFLERMPLNPNGKLDRAALPRPDMSQAHKAWVAPQSETERQVAAIWAQILDVERVGLTDHFFELGGHSLLAMQVVSRLRQVLGLEVPLRTLFEQPRLDAFVGALPSAGLASTAPAMVVVDRDRPLALSYAQERQWFLWQLEPESSAYHVPSALRLKGLLDRAALQRSFDTLMARHESLRTHLHQDGERAVQVIGAQASVEIACADTDEDNLKSRVQALIARPFDLQQGPLLRVQLLRLAEDDHVLVMVQHHIVSDGWSMQVMVDELVQLYSAYSLNEELQLPALPIQYADYAAWQRDWMEAGEKARQLDYWRGLLGGEQPVLELPTDHQRPAVQSHRGARLELALDTRLVGGLRALAQREGVTMFMLLLASFQTLLHRYSGQQDIRVGVPIANRNRVEVERLIGFFVNTQVLKADIDGQMTVDQLLAQVKQRALEAQAHQDLPFEQLVEALQPERSLSLNPLFQVMFNHQAQARLASAGRQASGLRLEALEWDSQTAHFDLDLDINEAADDIWASFGYATDLFEASTIERMARHWQNLLQAMVTNQQQAIGQLNLLDEAEQRQIIQLWDRTDSGFPATRLVHELVADRARETPEAVAVIFGEQQLTYGELERSANRLARALIARGVGPEVRVAIAMPRSAEIMVAFLAVLKSGGVYVPLDVEYPEDRLLYMMQDSRAQLLLTHSAVQQRLPVPEGLESLAVDRTEQWSGDDDSAPHVTLDGDNLAYVIYTSGSTGLPKGVAVSHGPLVAHIIATGERYEMTAADCELHFMSFAFDGSHEGWMHPLINGARVLIRDDNLWLPEQTYAQMHRHGVTVGVFPPVYLQQLAEHAERDGNPPAVRVYCFGGDAVAQASYDLAWRALRPTYLFNGYGPTETVVTPLLWKASKDDPCGAAYAPIGTLLGNRSGYVLDAELNLQPIGVAGELYLGGEGVARGYLERPALTAERFVPDPFGAPGSRVYRSGDLTRGRPDGVVDYLGRVDHQVKIRGFRIELGEIEARLREQEAVRETVVVAQSGLSGKQLVAYVVPVDPELVSDAVAQAQCRDALRQALKARLPDYMVPAHLMFLERMPLTPNGKLDRKGLPQPDASQLQQAYVAPQSELEGKIAAIWAEVLRLPRVGINDNFFELGGDSIISIQVVSRARQAGVRFTPKDLFQHQTVQSLASVAREGGEGLVIDQGPLSGDLLLLPIQKAFFDDEVVDRHHWNQSVALQAHGRLQPELLIQALQALLVHHDALRSQFIKTDKGWQASYRAADLHQAEQVLWCRSAEGLDDLTALAEQAQRSLDLGEGPLLRAVLVDLAEGTQRLLLVVHHLVVDGVSWRILLEDLQTAYRQLAEGQPVVLPSKTSSTHAWAQRLQAYAEDSALEREFQWWQAQLQDGLTDLPGADAQASLSNRHALGVTTHLDQAFTRRLLQDAPAAYRTQINDLLLTALARVIGRWTGQDSTLIRLEGHGREDLFEDVDLTRTVGWFTSIYPVRLRPATGIADSIKGIKEQLRAIPDKGIGFGALRYLGRDSVREALRQLPQPRITFNYLGQFDSSFDDAEQEGLFAPSGDSCGADQGPDACLGNWLEINGQVYNGELNLNWSFSQQMFDEVNIQHLADEYAEELKALIEHCCKSETRGVTPSDFPLARLDQEQLDRLPLTMDQVEDLYPLSPMQQGMLFHSLYGQASGDYVNQMRVDVEGLDVERFCAAWQAALQHHDVLRSGFLWQTDAEAPLQVVYKQVQLPVEQYDWQDREELQQALESLAQDMRQQGFALQQAPLLNLVLVRTATNRHHLIYTNHHILMDGWSSSQLFGEVLQDYAGVSSRASTGRYRDYIAWLQRQDAVLSEAFWKEQLASLKEPTRLARPLGQDVDQPQAFGDYRLSLGAEDTQRLKSFAQGIKVTLNTLVQAAWLLLLQRHTGQETVAFGATVSGRPAELRGIEQQVGLFINTLPVVASPAPELEINQWLQQLQEQNLRLREQEHSPLFEIQRWAGMGGEALFDSILVFENYPVSEALEQGAPSGLVFSQVDSIEQTNYPMTVALGIGEILGIEFNYDSRSFSAAQVRRLGEHFKQLLEAFIDAKPRYLADLPSLTDAEELDILRWNDARPAVSPLQLVHQLFEAQVRKRPEAVALQLDQECLSYAELNRQANRLAHQLIALGVGPEVLVGVALERSCAMVVSLLAILKAGGAYVPLDPQYPRERLVHMLEDSDVRLVLTHSHVPLALPDDIATLALDLVGPQLAQYPAENPGGKAELQNLAYVIYTSGSTGKPKGVAINHAALSEFSTIAADYSRLNEDDRVLQFATLNFDGFVEQLYPALTHGATVVLRGPQLWDSGRLYREIIDQGITLADLPTAYWNLFLLDCLAAGPRTYGALRQIHIGGEAMPLDGPAQWRRAGLGHVRLLNTYGPTEATVVSSVLDCSSDPSVVGASASPIGRALSGRALYVLDQNLNLAPFGAVGELYIGSACGLARSYLQRPSLTAERFVANPFGNGGERLYRTGDLARYRADGVVEYVGRVDHQVKIRGFRIELGEIETLLLAQDGVREALVLAADNQLLAYLVVEQAVDSPQARQLLSEQFKDALQAQLPDYMVPAHLIFLERMPLNPNGKLDRQALPRPDASLLQGQWEAPQSLLQQQVAAIWADVLGVERVGLTDHFFELGGHSLLAMQVVSRLRQVQGLEVPLKVVFEQPRLQAFVLALEALEGNADAGMPALVPVRRDQPLPLSYAQERQWFLWQLDPQGSAYHVPSALRLKGQLDVDALQRSFDSLVARHESLRTLMRQTDSAVVQVIAPQARIEMLLGDAQEEGLQALIEAEVQQPFDLQQGPLLRVKLLRLAEDDHVLVLVQHHIISDGWSMQVMVDELVQLYAAHSLGSTLQLPILPVQYADYAVWQRSWMEAGEKARQLNYWRGLLGDSQPVLQLPLDHARPALQSYRGAHLDIDFEPESIAALRVFAQSEGVTLFMVLLASFQALLHRYSGQHDIRVGVPVANRNRVETERLIGFFVNTQVLKADIDEQMTVSQLLAQVKQRALEAQSHQDLPFEQLVEALQPERSLSHNPLFQVMFNHQSEVRGAQVQSDQLPLQVSELPWAGQSAQFDLSLDTRDSDDGLWASLTYASDLFDATTIERMARHWEKLLLEMLANPQQQVSRLAILDDNERQAIVRQWNATERDYPLQRQVHQLIEEQVALAPEAPALVFAQQRLSYAELNRRANRLAHRLIQAGVGPDVLVGLAVERSIEMVVGLLAVLKAGGAYVPLDPEYPRERLAYMLEDSGVKLLLTQAHLLEQLPIPQGLSSLVLEQGEAWLEHYSEENPQIALDGENLAYVIYTSGSTGQPKGAGNRHSALLNRLCWMQEAYALGAGDTVLQKTPFSFDVSVWEFFWPLMTGARLVVAAPGDHRDPARLVSLINSEQVTTLHFVPSMLQAFLQDRDVGSCTSLQRIVCSGEALPVDAQQQVFAKLPKAGLYNLYGPTEAAIDVTHWTCVDEGRDGVPIGRPIANLGCYILDSNFEPVPVGVLGELYLGGVGLARGYHRRPALSAERFVAHPFVAGERLYRTGDLARYREDGVIEYAGRIDYQVKLRGLRIELGEIEARLLEHERVREAAVLAVDNQHLVGYLVLDGAGEDWREVLSVHLAAHLPDYMVPAQWVVLEQMPLSPNGKLDRKALPKPDASLQAREYVAPQSPLEQQVAAAWSEVLEVEQISLNDNFFELGGHSLLILMLRDRIKKITGVDLSVSQLMLHPTVRGQVGCIQGQEQGSLLVRLNAQSQGTPLFLFHPSFGSVHCYRAIALALREQRPVIGVICRALLDAEHRVPSWTDMVDDYVGQLLVAYPQGNYRLAGWSLGGNLAMEVAYRLERAGRHVESVDWIDAPPPAHVEDFWKEDLVAEPQVFSTQQRQAELLAVMFPEFAEQIGAQWQAAVNEVSDEVKAWQQLDAWAAEHVGSAYAAIREQLLDVREAQVSWTIKQDLDLRLQGADYQAIQAPVNCWWAAQGNGGQHRDLIEASMAQVVGQDGIRSSTVIDTTHDRIIDNPQFISLFVASMK
ncbi:MAG: non-ribosomal peptide synthase/polyketide synthase [Pseudomonas piscis]|uniref:non-ribosomal peptide synthase/polyketide synthase n=5 Tax=Pseudomonas TaxID=286 RepID=UPI003D2D4C26